MFTPLRHALSLAVGSALAVSASGALAGPDGSVFDKYNTQYFSGVGKFESPYDGTTVRRTFKSGRRRNTPNGISV